MADSKGFSSPTYTVDHYKKLCQSYSVRSQVIPHSDISDFIDFITRTVAFHGGLAGPISKASIFFSNKIKVTTADKMLKKNVESIMDNLGVFWTQYKAWMSIFMYDNTMIMYLPEQKLYLTCPECKTKFCINNKSYEYPIRIVDMEFERDSVRKLKSDARLATVERRKYARNCAVRCVCPSCNAEIIDTPDQVWDFNSSGSLVVLSPKMYRKELNDVGRERIIIDPKNYEGALAMDKELEWFHLSGVPWNLAVTYAAKDRIYIPDSKWYMTFSMREYVAVGNAGAGIAPILSSVSDTISMDVFKMGNEGLAFSKIDPLYVVSPHDINNPAFEGISHMDMRDFMVGGIKAHQEGDINRILYSPVPVTTDALFGDGKRFMHVQELVTFQNFVLGGLGLSADALNGSSGFTGDPVMFEGWNKLIGEFNTRYIRLIDSILKLNSVRYFEESRSSSNGGLGKISIWLPQMSQLRGGMDLEKKWALIESERIPFDEFTSDLGLPTPELWEESILASVRQQTLLDLKKGRVTKQLHASEMEKDNNEQGSGQSGPNMALARHNILQEAEYYASELTNMDQGQRQRYLAQIAKEDYVLHSVVLQKLKEFRKMEEASKSEQGEQQ